MSFSHLIKYGLSLPPHVALAKALQMAGRSLQGRWRTVAGKHRRSHGDVTTTPVAQLHRIFHMRGLPVPASGSLGLQRACERTLAHEFNLLGSGWTNVTPPSDAGDTPLSPGNQSYAAELRSRIDKDYLAIDWQRDFISGYRWSAAQASQALVYGHEPGVDIKFPWELARLQHLPQLALAGGSGQGDAKTTGGLSIYAREFCNQTLDFMAANPPGYGVNWVCTMDVAIRAANLIVAFDLFRAQNTNFDADFVNTFAAALRDHGRHIARNLEWHGGFRGNHYLADLTGLLFIAAFLPGDPQTECWLALAVQEFTNECRIQFHGDGSNAEASTSYHRLSAEMAVYGTALIMGLSDAKIQSLQTVEAARWTARPPLRAAGLRTADGPAPFAKDHFERLRKMARFTRDITKPNGQIIQIGDTDNGRFLKLNPAYLAHSEDEDHLNHSHLLAAIGGVLDDTWTHLAGPHYATEAALVGALKGHKPPPPIPTPASDAVPAPAIDPEPATATKTHQLVIELPQPDLLADLKAIAYKDFGLYIWRSERFFLAVRCGPIGQAGNGGHAHNDQLSVELQIDGIDWLADPGTATYTADTAKRDRYRSHLAHFGPRLQSAEPSRLDLGLFRLEDNAQAQCLTFDGTRFLGRHSAYGLTTYRHIHLGGRQIRITDSEGGIATADQAITQTTVHNADQLRQYFGPGVAFSRGYGFGD